MLRAARWLPLIVLVGLALVLANAWTAMGHRAVGARRARMERSPQWKDGHFVNPQPLHNDNWGAMTAMFHASPDSQPAAARFPHRRSIPPASPRRPPSGLRVTWLGHASALIEIDGARVLTDPVWSERASPLTWVGPQRWYRAARSRSRDLPPIDAVVISHDHYDHLDYAHHRRDEGLADDDVRGAAGHRRAPGVLGRPEARIVELDWWDRTHVGALEIVCTPARHASGRNMLFDRDAKLWAGYAFIGARHRVFFSGDTGLYPAMRDIGARLGPFDVTMIEVGQYHRAWPDWHIGPEQAVMAHGMLRGKVMLPMHWGLFNLAPTAGPSRSNARSQRAPPPARRS